MVSFSGKGGKFLKKTPEKPPPPFSKSENLLKCVSLFMLELFVGQSAE